MMLVSWPPSATSPWTLVMKVQKWSLTSIPLLLLILIKLMLGLPVMPMTPPPDDDDSDLQSDFSEQSLEDQLSDSEADSDVDGSDSTPDHPFSPPPQAIDTQEGTQFTMEFHPHSPGSSQRRTGKTKWETALEKEGPNPHFPWRDLEEWELVEWLVDQWLSQRSINDFIKNKWVCTSI